jgi:hypothetical protein
VQRRNTPWLGRFELSVTALLFVFGVVIVWWGNYAETGFIATVPQLAGTAVVVIGLIWQRSPSAGIRFLLSGGPHRLRGWWAARDWSLRP